MPKVTVLILNYNCWVDTRTSLESLKLPQGVQLKLVLIDNGSTDDSVEKIKEYFFLDSGRYFLVKEAPASQSEALQTRIETQFVNLTDNKGYAHGINTALEVIKKTNTDYYFFHNTGASVLPNTISNLVQFAQRINSPFVGPCTKCEETEEIKFCGRGGHIYHYGIYLKPKYNKLQKAWSVTSVEGSARMISAKMLNHRWDNYGYFLDPSFYMYCDYSDLANYVLAEGQAMWISEDAVMHHKRSTAAIKSRKNIAYYYLTRNRIRVAKRWLSPGAKLIFHILFFMSRIFLAVYQLLKGRVDIFKSYLEALFDAYTGKFGKWRRHP